MIYPKIENALIFLSPWQTKKKIFFFFNFQRIPAFFFLGILTIQNGMCLTISFYIHRSTNSTGANLQ